MNIGIIVFDDFTDLDFYLPWDLLNRVRLLKLKDNWNVEILCDSSDIKSASGLSLRPTKPYSFASKCDAVLFCSGSETRRLVNDKSFLDKFQLDEKKQYIAAIDSGALILGALGLLKGKRATTYPTAAEALKRFGVNVVEKAFVSEGNIATGARCLSGDKLALWMIEKLTDKDVAQKVFETVKPLE
ncbi:DJ-1/PfpI family protein [Bdellovibrio sp. HCB337]|uniref:DJ-1/PfpI family protein n=1 Tax=Bdellovibrio sp. HCB337 TaxID=3394358 RepID=UPI0039A65252